MFHVKQGEEGREKESVLVWLVQLGRGGGEEGWEAVCGIPTRSFRLMREIYSLSMVKFLTFCNSLILIIPLEYVHLCASGLFIS